MAHFQYDQKIIENYPALRAGVVVATGVQNPRSPDALRALYFAEQEKVKARIGKTPLSELESLSAWRRAISAFGVSPTKYRSAAESLLRRLTKKGDIPSINTLVDLGNLVSIRYAVPVAIFDTRGLKTPITVHYAAGDEPFVDLGSSATTHPEPGEVIFSDETNMVVARRWCWRQSGTSASSAATTDAVITVEAHHADGAADIAAALDDLLGLLRQFAGGAHEAAQLSADKTSF